VGLIPVLPKKKRKREGEGEGGEREGMREKKEGILVRKCKYQYI
jgi:hypothetical protein